MNTEQSADAPNTENGDVIGKSGLLEGRVSDKTPRTDAAVYEPQPGLPVVPASFARQLERELNAAREANKKDAEAWLIEFEKRDGVFKEIDSLRVRLAATEARLEGYRDAIRKLDA